MGARADKKAQAGNDSFEHPAVGVGNHDDAAGVGELVKQLPQRQAVIAFAPHDVGNEGDRHVGSVKNMPHQAAIIFQRNARLSLQPLNQRAQVDTDGIARLKAVGQSLFHCRQQKSAVVRRQGVDDAVFTQRLVRDAFARRNGVKQL